MSRNWPPLSNCLSSCLFFLLESVCPSFCPPSSPSVCLLFLSVFNLSWACQTTVKLLFPASVLYPLIGCVLVWRTAFPSSLVSAFWLIRQRDLPSALWKHYYPSTHTHKQKRIERSNCSGFHAGLYPSRRFPLSFYTNWINTFHFDRHTLHHAPQNLLSIHVVQIR